MNETQATNQSYRDPGQYEIRLVGHLDVRWSDQFDSLTVIHERDGSTILSGPVRDQAALHGLLKKVRDLGIPLVSVSRVGSAETDGASVTEYGQVSGQ